MPTELSIAEFCDRHNACKAGHIWALANCKTMREAWDTAKPKWVLWIATRPGVLPPRMLRLLAVRFARTVAHLMTDQRSRDALNVAERHANWLATDEELDAARAAAHAAYDAAAYASYAAYDAADADADAAANAAAAAAAAAYNAAADAADAAYAAYAAYDAAAHAAYDAAAYASYAAAYVADAWSNFAKLIREFTPNFEK